MKISAAYAALLRTLCITRGLTIRLDILWNAEPNGIWHEFRFHIRHFTPTDPFTAPRGPFAAALSPLYRPVKVVPAYSVEVVPPRSLNL